MITYFTIETDAVVVTWKARKAVTNIFSESDPSQQPYGLDVLSYRGKHIAISIPDQNTPTHLFEQQEYALFIRSRDNQPLRLLHEDPVLQAQMNYEQDNSIVYGMFSMGSHVGVSRFEIVSQHSVYLSFEVEVLPSKLNYKTDYQALLADLFAIHAAWSLSYLQRTTQGIQYAHDDASSLLSWVKILAYNMTTLEDAMRFIASQPNRELHTEHAFLPIHSVKKVDPSIFRAMRLGKGMGSVGSTTDTITKRERLLAQHYTYTLNTTAHRWVKYQLDSIHQQVQQLITRWTTRSLTERTRALRTELILLRDRIHTIRKAPFLVEAEGPVPASIPHIIVTAPGYRDVYQCCLLLKKALHFPGNILRTSLKDLHLLYEYWCFLGIIRSVRTYLELPYPITDWVHMAHDGLHISLKKGQVIACTMYHAQETRVQITYSPYFGGDPHLVPQRPNFLLEVTFENGDKRRAILDAKYRLDDSPGYKKRYGVWGPPTDALNTLHRYRDAIRKSEPGNGEKRYIDQAIALYPLPRQEAPQYAVSKLWEGLYTLGIGAIPFLPGNTKFFETWLRAFLTHGEELTDPTSRV